jgi:hypothetical protein
MLTRLFSQRSRVSDDAFARMRVAEDLDRGQAA